MPPKQSRFKGLRKFFTVPLRNRNSAVSQAGRAPQDRAPEPESDEQRGSDVQLEPMAAPAPPQNDVTSATERPLEYQENLANLDDPGALGDVTRWAFKTIEERKPDDPKPDDPRRSWIAQWILARDNAEFPPNDDVAGRLETLMEDFQHARYHGHARDAARWNSTLISAFMTKFAGNLNIEPLKAVESAEPPVDASSAYSSPAQPEPREPSERVVTWQGPPERFKLNSLYPWSETSKSNAESYRNLKAERAKYLSHHEIKARDYGYPEEDDVFKQTQKDVAVRKRRKETEKQIRAERETDQSAERETDQSKDPLSQER